MTDSNRRTVGLLQQIADTLGARPPLNPSSQTKTKSLQLAETIARRLFIIPQLVGDSVATVTKTIGTAKDYSSPSSWESDLDNGGIYSSGDNAVGECYSQSFDDETCTIDGGGTVGLSSRTLSVASGERHDGTAGSGARITLTSNASANTPAIRIGIDNTTVEWLELDGAGYATNLGFDATFSANARTYRNCIVHDLDPSGSCNAIDGRELNVMNCIVYDIKGSSGYGIGYSGTSSGGLNLLNCTVYDVTGYCFALANQSDKLAKNCIGMSGSTADFQTGTRATYCVASDTSPTGTGSLTSKTATDQFVSVTNGSGDFHLKSNSTDASNSGTDLGTTPSGVEIDIDGRNRDTEGDTWDIGAHEYVAAGGSSNGAAAYHHYQTIGVYSQTE